MELKNGYQVKIKPECEIDKYYGPTYVMEMEELAQYNNRIFIIRTYDGADCIVLSGKNIRGKMPIQTFTWCEEYFDLSFTEKIIRAFDRIASICEKKCRTCSYEKCELVKTLNEKLSKVG